MKVVALCPELAPTIVARNSATPNGTNLDTSKLPSLRAHDEAISCSSEGESGSGSCWCARLLAYGQHQQVLHLEHLQLTSAVLVVVCATFVLPLWTRITESPHTKEYSIPTAITDT